MALGIVCVCLRHIKSDTCDMCIINIYLNQTHIVHNIYKIHIYQIRLCTKSSIKYHFLQSSFYYHKFEHHHLHNTDFSVSDPMATAFIVN